MRNRPNIENSTILVTGGAGFIGSHLVDRLIVEGAKEVVIIDNMFLGSEENLKDALLKGAILYKDDIEIASSLDYIFEKHDIDIVFNCATKALNYSFVNPKNAFDTNINGILNILEHQRRGDFKTLVHFSTSEVYGTAEYEPMDEKHPLKPTTTYAAGKASADIALYSWVNMFDLDAFIVRPFNNYGPRQNHKGYMAGIIPITAFRILNDINPEIHGTGLQSRDFIYVLDTVDAIIKLYSLMKRADSINISTDGQISMKDVIRDIVDIMEYRGEVLERPTRGADVECHNACNKKIKSMIDYKLTSFEDGLRKTIKWYQENIV
ncbi:NAD-dependent epimerase/dehydratase family protein [Sulfurovum sp. bin170]|uniref:dTDP-glucose 4,6-dehydratase n=1 Tax=Sulfurovum sp. bin170 TaxID=2695268 RepID=UPI0013E05925|nr:NAD-dependent epimerase/dehydratase family protein [Sulfurovum sp. bin170]NEW60727.1 NAD-dependent epimerase/dehydratase family protein [Sulfurovum sp. bin170]